MTSIHALFQTLSGAPEQGLLERDYWRLCHHFYGPYARTGSLFPHAVFWGGDSGLFPLLQAATEPGSRVLVFEPEGTRARRLREAATRLALQNLEVVETQALAFESIGRMEGELGLLAVSQEAFSREVLECFRGTVSIDRLIGVFDESKANPLWLHRASRLATRRFHWHNQTTDLPLVGTAFEGPDVSVIVPAYGIEAYLDRCLESLTRQTLESLEIIVVDDGAKDRSGLIADDWAMKDPRVRVIHQANAGCAAARSNGLKAATGYWVGLVDGDDWVDEAMFEALAESSVRFTSDIAQCGYRHCFDSDGSWIDEKEWPDLRLTHGDGSGLLRDPRALIPLRPTIWRRLYRRDFLVDHGLDFPVAIRRFDDLPFHFMTLALADRVSVVNAPYYHYRQQRPGQDINITDQRLNVHFPIFEGLRAFVRSHYSAELEALLFKTQVASHAWAHSMIQPALKKVYRRAAKYDLFGAPLVLSPEEKLKAAADLGRGRLSWAKGTRRLLGTGEREWQSVRDYDR